MDRELVKDVAFNDSTDIYDKQIEAVPKPKPQIGIDLENSLYKIKDLKESPLYNLSLVNKELFHSNFIAWFGKTYPAHFIELIEILLDKKKWLDGDKFDIRREFNHFDISVFEGENLKLVIENKVKSIPTQNQLDEYKNKIKNENAFEDQIFAEIDKNIIDRCVKELKQVVKNGKVLKEQKFVMQLDYKEIDGELAGNDVLVQGVCDLVVIKENKAYLYDYKYG